MKTLKLLKNIGLLLSFGWILIACSSDDTKGDGSPNYLENVPKGEIVPIEQRFITLTGYDESAATESTSATERSTDSQKWWGLEKEGQEDWCGSKYLSSDMPGSPGFIGFYPNGEVHYTGGEIEKGQSEAYANWEWVDSSKIKIVITYIWAEDKVEIVEITELNNLKLVTVQITSNEECERVSWKQYKAAN